MREGLPGCGITPATGTPAWCCCWRPRGAWPSGCSRRSCGMTGRSRPRWRMCPGGHAGDEFKEAAMTWTTVSLQVTTPLFNGGAYEGGDCQRPARRRGRRPGASIRGAMRFWFRALAGSVIGPDLKLLSCVESKVFGSAERSSPLVLRIATQPSRRPPIRAELPVRPVGPGRRSPLNDLPAGSEPGRHEDRQQILRPYVAPGLDSSSRLASGIAPWTTSGTEAIEALAFASLWLMCVRRGGARTRGVSAASALPPPPATCPVRGTPIHC